MLSEGLVLTATSSPARQQPNSITASAALAVHEASTEIRIDMRINKQRCGSSSHPRPYCGRLARKDPRNLPQVIGGRSWAGVCVVAARVIVRRDDRAWSPSEVPAERQESHDFLSAHILPVGLRTPPNPASDGAICAGTAAGVLHRRCHLFPRPLTSARSSRVPRPGESPAHDNLWDVDCSDT